MNRTREEIEAERKARFNALPEDIVLLDKDGNPDKVPETDPSDDDDAFTIDDDDEPEDGDDDVEEDDYVPPPDDEERTEDQP
jgi:hypothetical protein